MSIASSIASISTSDRLHAGAYLAELDQNDKQKPNAFRAFQHYPDSIQDSRSTAYQEKNVIGSSHPLYQWVHGSGRTISFEAIFTSDFNGNTLSGGQSGLDSFQKAADSVSSIAKNPVIGAASAISPNGQKGMDVAAAIAWLRAKTYPLYQAGRVQAPPKLLLWLENSGLTSFTGGFHLDIIPVVMTECNVHYEAFFRNGRPRIAVVSLAFAEIIQVGKSWGYANRSDLDGYWGSGYLNSTGKKFVQGRKQ
jgi:hypothetical protein